MRQLRQRGSALLAITPLLLVMGLMLAASSQRLATERRSAANQADRQSAFQAAEAALAEAEQQAARLDRELGIANQPDATLFGAAGLFSDDCRNPANPAGWQSGLCRPAQAGQPEREPPWQRLVTIGGRRWPLLHPCGHGRELVLDGRATTRCGSGDVLAGGALWANPRYLVELLQRDYSDGQGNVGRLYRLSARGWGRNRNSQATLQSYALVPETTVERAARLGVPVLPPATAVTLRRLAWREVF
ncbi:pilus assembly protein [Neisseriaceae bacterium JH1-16]|nr:pilus assembly protein [Neisseriaceae bacterium JH1-16]